MWGRDAKGIPLQRFKVFIRMDQCDTVVSQKPLFPTWLFFEGTLRFSKTQRTLPILVCRVPRFWRFSRKPKLEPNLFGGCGLVFRVLFFVVFKKKPWNT